jgi:peptidoglycan/LPS O-acetylase OafA/YrhL
LPIDTAPDRAAATTRSGYMPALDGLRAISISLVVISHWGHGLDRIFPGLFGVVIFFVISGFLITRQLAQELAHSGTLNLRAFYRRRFFRLAPALLLYLTIFLPVLLALGAIMTPIQIAAGVFYFANYYHLFIGYWPLSPMPILWSLSVEEHFYLLFPLCLLGFSRNVKTILPWLCVALIGVFLWRVKLYSGCSTDPAWWACGWPGIIRVYGTDAIFDCILYGCITALALHYFPARVRSLFINRAAFSVALLGVFASLVIRNPAFRETALQRPIRMRRHPDPEYSVQPANPFASGTFMATAGFARPAVLFALSFPLRRSRDDRRLARQRQHIKRSNRLRCLPVNIGQPGGGFVFPRRTAHGADRPAICVKLR